jgi:hypothetical protein
VTHVLFSFPTDQTNFFFFFVKNTKNTVVRTRKKEGALKVNKVSGNEKTCPKNFLFLPLPFQ